MCIHTVWYRVLHAKQRSMILIVHQELVESPEEGVEGKVINLANLLSDVLIDAEVSE